MPNKGSPQYKTEIIHFVPWRRFLSRGGFLTILLLAMVAAYYLGGLHSAAWRVQLEKKNSEQKNAISQLQKKYDILKRQQSAAALEVELGVRANEALRKDLVEADRIRSDLEEQIVFYKGLMDPSMDGAISFRRVEVTGGSLVSDLLISGVIQQLTLNHQLIKGNLQIAIEGIQTRIDDEGRQVDVVRRLNLQELGVDNTIPLRFKYFQNFSLNVKLPSNFSAKTLYLIANTGKNEKFESELAWAEIINLGG